MTVEEAFNLEAASGDVYVKNGSQVLRITRHGISSRLVFPMRGMRTGQSASNQPEYRPFFIMVAFSIDGANEVEVFSYDRDHRYEYCGMQFVRRLERMA